MHPEVYLHVTKSASNANVSLTQTSDRYVEVAANNKIMGVYICDPICGDIAPHGGNLILHDNANENWTYANGVFTPFSYEITKNGNTYTVTL